MNLLQTIDELRRYLPIQFPLGVFIHNNMLMAFEDRPFREGVKEAAAIFGAKQTLEESYYLEKWRAGRIAESKAREQLALWMQEERISERIGPFQVSELLWSLLQQPVTIAHRAHDKDEDDSYNGWLALAVRLEPPPIPPGARVLKPWKHRLHQDYGEDLNGLYHSIIIRFLSAYLDQGLATWHNPDSNLGLLESFRAFLGANRRLAPQWMERAYQEIADIPVNDLDSWLERQLARLPYAENPRQYLLETLLELRGWAGMVNKFEKEPHLIPRHNPKITLLEYLVINVLLERSAYEYAVKKLQLDQGPGLDLAPGDIQLTLEQVTCLLHSLGDRFAITPQQLDRYSAAELLQLVTRFNDTTRSQIWHFAFDYSVRDQCLAVLATQVKSKPEAPDFEARAYFCIDDREESFRRYVEEINPRFETLGVVGFFGLDMRFKSADHPEPVIYCPPVVTPSRVIEQVTLGAEGQRVRERRNLGKGSRNFFYGTRAAFSSLFYTLLTGPFTSCVLLLRVFFPHLATRAFARARDLVVRPLPTKIHFNAEDGRGGYSVPEMANVVATIMKFTGTIQHFPRLQFMIAHGATSTNNPYKNAYGCGACSGKAGIPNSQIFCGMANNPKVREELVRAHGITIPSTTFFVACYHDTSTDEVLCFNAEEAPLELRADLERLLENLREAARKNSLERCRHFAAGREMLDEKITFQHVQNRSSNLAEPRPEYGHTNNALCVIGPRALTKGLYLDRRSFLASYDAKTDPEGKVLAQVMAGAVPVAGGINLDYYFSRVDNEIYGSGTKLPLNVAGLLGVMTGGQSDLRIGLARQMVELHEPVRITIAIVADPAVVMGILEKAPRQLLLVKNHWIHMVVIHPATGQFFLFENGAFQPTTPLSQELAKISDQRRYVAHQKGPLPFAQLVLPGRPA